MLCGHGQKSEEEEALTCGTHFGLTKLPASISLKPVLASLLINSILVVAEIVFFSFCSPSLAPTSTSFTYVAAGASCVGVLVAVAKVLR